MLTLAAGGSELDVALLGATPLRWSVVLVDGPVDVVDGYRDADELLAQDGVRNGIMAPFCNRVKDGRYVFDGAEHDLLPGATDRTIYHGLTRTRPFTVVDVRTGNGCAGVTLRCAALAEDPAPGYPFAVVVDVRFDLHPTSLRVEISGTNRGADPAPFATGWHPYFRLPGAPTIDDLHLVVPSTRPIRTDRDLIPLPGGAAFDGGPPGVTRWSPLGGAVIDMAYEDLQTDAGAARTALSAPGSGVGLVLLQERGLVHVFTGDTLTRDRRRSVALEPVEAMTDAFNRPDCAEAIRLEPGATRTFTFDVALKPGRTTVR